MKRYYFIFSLLLFIQVGCQDGFLDKKPSADIVIPNSLTDLQKLLENYPVMNVTPGLGQISADEYELVDGETYRSLVDPITRNAYLWEIDLYEGQESVLDWNIPYKQIFYANSILQVLDERNFRDKNTASYLKGWALFVRAHAYFQLVLNFSVPYNDATAVTDVGVPIRLSASIDETRGRAEVWEVYRQILDDLNVAIELLPEQAPLQNKNRPSKSAVLGLLARIHLYMGDYEKAEYFAENCLMLYDKLVDYNLISTTSATPFGGYLDEVLYSTSQIVAYYQTSGYGNTPAITISPELLALYDENDLRFEIFYNKMPTGHFNKKRGYLESGLYPFTGIATDEIYLILAESRIRNGRVDLGITVLEKLLEKRFKTGAMESLVVRDAKHALELVWQERRKELVWRGLRWFDLKRLNREGENIGIERILDGNSARLAPNSSRYVFPIPSNEISLSGIQQNNRN